jgi:6-phosphogluconolactonase
VNRELRVVDDLAQEGAALFLAVRPRTVTLAGGATPRRLHERLAQLDYAWAETDVCFGDERCVPPDHPDSNFRMVNEALLSRVRARAHRMQGETCDAMGYEKELASIFGPALPRFDLVFLGLGADGHTASLFPGDPALDVVDRWVTRVERPDYHRLTLTLPVLSAASTAVFLVSGERKREALGRLMADSGIPAARVAAERVVVLADRAAAGGVS